MNNDLYAGFARRNYLFDRPGADIVEFFRALFARNRVRTVLDCACGAGFELLIFHELGCQAVGSDLSDEMLELAKENLAEADVDIPLHRVDYRDLPQHFSERFDAVVCWSASIIHVSDDNDALRAFRSMREALIDGGILILDQGITDRRHREMKRFSLSRDTPDATRIYVADELNERNVRYTILDVVHSETGGQLHVWTTDGHILLRDDQERLLSEAGFSSVDFFGTYDFQPYRKQESLRLIAVARK